MLTDPYVPDVATRLQDGVRHVHRVTAYRPADGIDQGRLLDLVTATLTIDEDASPRFVFTGAVGLDTQELLDYLDPRTGTRLAVWAGYEYADRTTDLHLLCTLGLRTRVVRRPQSDVVVTAGGDELRVMDHTLTAPVTFPATATVRMALDQLITAHGGDPLFITARRAADPLVEPLTVNPGDEWSTVQDLVERIGAVVYHDGLARFVVEDQPTEVAAAAVLITPGARGTLTGSEVALDREEFANVVVVEHRWRDEAGTEHVASGHAQVTAGPYGTAAIGRVGLAVVLTTPGTTATATATAAAMLTRTISRGRRVHVETAVAAYWLRPGHTAVIRLPLGADERALAAQVTFDLPAGTMSLHTRQPEPVTITTGA